MSATIGIIIAVSVFVGGAIGFTVAKLHRVLSGVQLLHPRLKPRAGGDAPGREPTARVQKPASPSRQAKARQPKAKAPSKLVTYADVLNVAVDNSPIAVVVVGLLPEQAFMYIMSIATISAIINWATIIITQMLFRRRLAPETRANLKFQMPGAPVTNWIFIAFLVLMIVVMLIMPPFRIAVAIGPIWLAALTLGRWLSRRRNQSRA